jgi:hypoxanthine-DNA glycosylase
VLILGSLPSRASISAQQYYAHPRNVFWQIMGEIANATGAYAQRCKALEAARIALWDVLASSIRPGSLDTDIRLDSAVANDFGSFFRTHPELRLVCFNGRKAEQMYRRFAGQVSKSRNLRFECLPSTSPAHAAMPFGEKLSQWRGIIGPQLVRGNNNDRIRDAGHQPLR